MRNIEAVGELSEIVRTSFGPNGASNSVTVDWNEAAAYDDSSVVCRLTAIMDKC